MTPPVPWHRVISSAVTITITPPGSERQRQALEAEGIEVVVGRTGELRVNLSEWGWFPDPEPEATEDAGEE